MRTDSSWIVVLFFTACASSSGFSIAEGDVPGCDAGSGDSATSSDGLGLDGMPSCDKDAHPAIPVRIVGLRNDAGEVLVALFTSAANFDAHQALRGGTAAITDGTAQVVFANVPPGTYAVSFIHDENSNGKLDTNAFGIPTEGFGFSRDATGSFGPPAFEQVRFDHADAAPSTETLIHATYY